MKINMYYKNDGTKVSSHTRGHKAHKNAPKRIVGSARPIKRVLWFVAILIGINWFCSTIEVSFTDPKVEAQEVAPNVSPLTIEQGFESADMPKQDVTVEDKIKTAFPNDWKIMLAIAKAESNLNPLAFNPDSKYGCAGVFQINLLPERQITRAQMENVDENIAYAKLLHSKSGYQPWSAYNNKSYLRYLK